MMRIEFLGTGGAITTPRPLCDCAVCVEAQARGVPYTRSGPSIFVHGPNILIDTPEEIKDQLNRAHISRIDAGLYSHWHPDHTAGSRIWETINNDWRGLPPRPRCTPIYLPQQVAVDWTQRLALQEKFGWLTKMGVVDVRVVPDGETISIGDVTVRPFRLAEEYVYAFELRDEARRVLIAMDELHGWTPPPAVQGVDLAILPMGIPEFNPLTGERLISAEHPVLKVEATFSQTLEMVRQLKAKQVILTHIEEQFHLSHDDLHAVAIWVHDQHGLDIAFAYDTQIVEVGT